MSSSRPRRSFSAKFKAEVVLSLLTGAKTQAELCRQHELSPNLVSQWKDAFLQNAAAAFQTNEQNSTEAARVADLERALGSQVCERGRATLENDILKKASSASGLARASWARTKAGTRENPSHCQRKLVEDASLLGSCRTP